MLAPLRSRMTTPAPKMSTTIAPITAIGTTLAVSEAVDSATVRGSDSASGEDCPGSGVAGRTSSGALVGCATFGGPLTSPVGGTEGLAVCARERVGTRTTPTKRRIEMKVRIADKDMMIRE